MSVAPQPLQPPPPRLLTLDAMRGVAALLVVLYHLRDKGVFWAQSGYLAVDFFFLLSGFVIARTYDHRQINALAFAKLRLIRLYPLFFAGLMLGVAQRAWELTPKFAEGVGLTFSQFLISLQFNLLLLPSPATQPLFPLNGPAWSLFFELLANLAYGFFFVRWRLATLRYLLVIAAVFLTLCVAQSATINGGSAWPSAHIGLARVMFSFLAGIILARTIAAPARHTWWSLVPVTLLITVLLIPPPSGQALLIYELGVVMVVAPAIVWLGARFNPPLILNKISAHLGHISYAIYAIHHPLIFIGGYCALEAGLPNRHWIPVFLIALIWASWGLARHWDPATQSWLKTWMLPISPSKTSPSKTKLPFERQVSIKHPPKTQSKR